MVSGRCVAEELESMMDLLSLWYDDAWQGTLR